MRRVELRQSKPNTGIGKLQAQVDASDWQLLNDVSDISAIQDANQLGIVKASFPGLQSSSTLFGNNGIVCTFLKAYQHNLDLCLRPDDVWLAILSQISCWMNGEAGYREDLENMRTVARTKPVKPNASDGLTQKNVLDGLEISLSQFQDAFTDWVIPKFSTSLNTDVVVAATLITGIPQKSSVAVANSLDDASVFSLGLQSVTLMGKKADWELLVRKVAQFANDEFDLFSTVNHSEVKEWSDRVLAVVTRMRQSCFANRMPVARQFWDDAIFILRRPDDEVEEEFRLAISGWITSFCFWNEDGVCLDPRVKVRTVGVMASKPDLCNEDERYLTELGRTRIMTTDDVVFHSVFPQNIPSNLVASPLPICAEGSDLDSGLVVLAGFVGSEILTTNTIKPPNSFDRIKTQLNSLQIRLGWWVVRGAEDWTKYKEEIEEIAELTQSTEMGDDAINAEDSTGFDGVIFTEGSEVDQSKGDRDLIEDAVASSGEEEYSVEGQPAHTVSSLAMPIRSSARNRGGVDSYNVKYLSDVARKTRGERLGSSMGSTRSSTEPGETDRHWPKWQGGGSGGGGRWVNEEGVTVQGPGKRRRKRKDTNRPSTAAEDLQISQLYPLNSFQPPKRPSQQDKPTNLNSPDSSPKTSSENSLKADDLSDGNTKVAQGRPRRRSLGMGLDGSNSPRSSPEAIAQSKRRRVPTAKAEEMRLYRASDLRFVPEMLMAPEWNKQTKATRRRSGLEVVIVPKMEPIE